MGLSRQQAQAAWEKAVEKAGGRKITARLVKAAMQDLQFPPKAPAPVAKKRRANRAEQRRLVDDTLGQVLVLLSQKASHNILTEILEALHRQIQTLFDE